MNIAMLLELAADGIGSRVAIGPVRSGLTYRELRDVAATASSEFTGTETLAVAAPTGVATPIAMFASAYAGVTYAPLNYRLPAGTQSALVGRLGAARLIGDDAASWLAATTHRTAVEVAYPDDPERPAVLLYTSGTSAEPEQVLLRHDNLMAYVLNTVDFACAGEDEAVLVAVPPFHIAGVAAVLTAVYAGRRIVPLPAFSAEEWLDTVRRESVTHAFVVPTMLARIVALMEQDRARRVPSLRSLAYGGARMPVPVLERALEVFPDTGFVNAYGLTETSSTICLLGPDDHAAGRAGDALARQRLGSVGRPVPGIEVEVVDDAGVPVPRGVLGRLRVRGAQVSGDGWLETGDVASMDAGGYVFVLGRRDDVIISGGENISPAEIEDVLLRHPRVAAAAAVGVPDAEWGERVEAVVVSVPSGAAEPAVLIAWCREQLGSLKTPVRVHVRDELPLTPTGKLQRRVLRDQLASGGRG